MIVGQLKPHVVRAAITFNSQANDKHRRNIINRPACAKEACEYSDGNFDRLQNTIKMLIVMRDEIEV